jgi:hypothetical protein
LNRKSESAGIDIQNNEAEAAKNESILKDLLEIKRGLFESVTKEMKNFTKKNLDKIKSLIATDSNDKVTKFLLDSMTQIMVGDKTASYSSQGSALFINVEDLQQNIRKVNYGKLESDIIQGMMVRLCGSENSDGGDISNELSEEKNVKKYIDFFCYFKTLSKMCHLAMTTRKEVNQLKKIQHAKSTIANSKTS